MKTAGSVGGLYRPLSTEDIERIHGASLEILQRVGIKSHNKEALEVFAAGGAEVDFKEKRVRIPPHVVRDALAKAPSKVILCGREERHDLILEDKRVYMGTGGAALNVLDLDTGKIRPGTLKDVAEMARLVDALDQIHFYIRPVVSQDIPKEIEDVNKFYVALSNTTKHVMGSAYSVETVEEVIALAEEIAGGAEELRRRSIISFITSCIKSPLELIDTTTDILIKLAKERIPVAPSSAPASGSTAPITLAGTIAQVNAEELSAIVLTQLVNPGTPVLYSGIPTVTDLRNMAYLSGAMELGILNAAIAQLAQYYNLPFYAWAGMSDSKIPDIQAGYEKAVTLLLVALAGANYIHNAAGMLESTTTVAYEQYVIDNEIIGMVARVLRGIEVNEETLALDIISRVGPGGHFLAEEHTVKFMRSEFFYPKVADRDKGEIWLEKGGKDARERAKKIAKDILAHHRPLPIPEEIDKRIKSKIKGLVSI